MIFFLFGSIPSKSQHYVLDSVLSIHPTLVNKEVNNFQFADSIGIASTPALFLTTIGEVICPALVIVGYKTRWASLPIVIVMAVAGFIVHGPDPFGKKELALLYLTCFIVIILLGPGRYSIDKK